VKDPRRSTLLRRLLGPEGPEVTCEVCFEELDFYVDLELAGADAEGSMPGMAAHLQGCPACSEEHASLTALVTALTRSLLPE
jgi:anti-sigma factor RsiW